MANWYNFGEFVESPQITPELVQQVYADAAKRTAAVRDIPLVQIVSVLDRVGRKLQERDHPVRKEIIRVMPPLIHFSKEMVESGLDAICDILDYENLIRRVAVDLDDERHLDGFVYNDRFRGSVRAVPQGVVSHVSAGNVFVSAVDTLAQGMITKNVNILKMSSFDPVFPLLFARIVKECDPENAVSPFFALIPFRGGDTAVEKIVKEKSDAIIVYGGKETVEAYRGGRGLHTKEIEYGPKYSLVILDQEALGERDSDEVAEQVARDFTMWEQAACSSPHCVFVKGESSARNFAQSLKKAFERMAREFPFPDIDVNEKTEITRTRELARVEAALGRSEVMIPDVSDQSWTIILDKYSRFNVSCQHRTAYVVAVNNDDEIFEALSGYGKFIQSIGLLAGPSRLLELSNRLVALGADRVTEIGRMHKRKHGTPHDGTRGVAELVRWVSLAQGGKFDEPLDFESPERRNALLLARLNRVLGVAREKSSFYKDRIPDEPLKTIGELERIPILSSKDFRAHLPPYGEGILTAPLGDSISFSSGGTTGAPKFVYRTQQETRRNARGMAKGFALGLFDEGEVVANLFFAGNMWASFITANLALEQVGVHTLPIGGHIPLESIISYLRSFNAVGKLDGVISIPSVLLGIAQYVEKNNIGDLRIPKIGYGGEHLAPAARDYLKKVLKADLIASCSYAINDTGVVGYQCKSCIGSIHHVEEGLHLLEIVDPETGLRAKPGEVGNIVVTNIDRTLMPVVRYDVGDRGRMVEGPCSCGRRTPRFELLGRSDEVVVIGADNVSIDAIAACVSAVAGLSQNFTIFGKQRGGLDCLEVQVEALDPVGPKREVELGEALLFAILKEKPVLATNVASGLVERPAVVILSPGTLPRNPKTGKIRRVVEERK